MTRKSVSKWIGKALAVGASAALKDAYHLPKDAQITEDAMFRRPPAGLKPRFMDDNAEYRGGCACRKWQMLKAGG